MAELEATPPRLSVLLASEAPIGVVFRRGPSKFVRVVIWNRAKDTFQTGPKFRGRIFADRSDLSPDGRHLIYFAMGGVAWAIPETGGTWTAISTLPSLTANALWGQGDTRGGGGMWTSNQSFWLDADHNTFLIRDHSGFRRDPNPPVRNRLEREGWVGDCKILPRGWILRKLGDKGGYELEYPGRYKLSFPKWEWADWDRDRLVWAELGRLQTGRIGANKIGSVRSIFDFNPRINGNALPL